MANEEGEMMKFDLVIKNCRIVDPKNRTNWQASIGILDGVIEEVSEEICTKNARQVIHLPGKLLMPGLIDTHVHCSSWLGGPLGYAMMARAGVTTAVDFAGPFPSVLSSLQEQGSGINIAVINAVRPDPGNKEITSETARQIVKESLESGALGVKLVGGHYPLSPESTKNIIKAAHEEQAYIAFHAGSTQNGSNLNGMMDAIDFSEGLSFHLAHVNAYCRGLVLGNVVEEVEQAIDALKNNRHIISEFHAAPLNGTSGICINGIPESHITRTGLKMGGFTVTEKGLKDAFANDWALCVGESIDGENRYLKGQDALNYWNKRSGDCVVCFPVNDRLAAFLCATLKDNDGRLVIDALSTDGGGIPRNFLLKYGLQLVEWGAWTLDEFVTRTSYVPSLMMGLSNKGHLTPGADADITVVDLDNREAILTIAGGEIISVNGIITGKGGTILCTEHGEKACRESGKRYRVIDLAQSMLYKGRTTLN